ncbi:thiaminase II [Acidobacteria bacterium AH-259-D05]|nr:thiaminase II [Acidobacteria bacterium AH-259-D05]
MRRTDPTVCARAQNQSASVQKGVSMRQWLVLMAIGSLALQPAPANFTDQLWELNRDIYEETLRHPFLSGLVDGTLSREAFTFYMIQDAHYLREFARALSVTASKAPREDWATLLSTHAVDTFKSERQLHETVFKEYGISSEQVRVSEPSPEAFGYTSFLVSTAYSRPFAESLAALLPCYWIYWEIGKELKKQGSKDPIYQKWIDAYASQEYSNSVQAVLRIVDEVAASANLEELRKMKENFRRSARYEWMFWDSAYHQRSWPPQGR